MRLQQTQKLDFGELAGMFTRRQRREKIGNGRLARRFLQCRQLGPPVGEARVGLGHVFGQRNPMGNDRRRPAGGMIVEPLGADKDVRRVLCLCRLGFDSIGVALQLALQRANWRLIGGSPRRWPPRTKGACARSRSKPADRIAADSVRPNDRGPAKAFRWRRRCQRFPRQLPPEALLAGRRFGKFSLRNAG